MHADVLHHHGHHIHLLSASTPAADRHIRDKQATQEKQTLQEAMAKTKQT